MIKRILIIISIMMPSYLLATLATPSKLELVPTKSTVTLSWKDNSEEAHSFKIFRDDELIAITATDATTYKDVGLLPKVSYKYMVKETDSPLLVLVGNSSIAENKAADILINYIRLSTGIEAIKTDIYQEDNNTYFVIGLKNSYASAYPNRTKRDVLGDDGFEIYHQNQIVSIAGATTRATLYGVYHYLREYLGWEWYSLDDNGSTRQKIDSIVFPKDFERVVPRFSYREVFSPEGGDNSNSSDGTPFALKSYLNGQLGHRYIDQYLKQQDGFGRDLTTVSNILDLPILSDETGAIKRVVDGVNYVYSRDDLKSATGELYKRPYSDVKLDLLSYGVVKHIDGSARSHAKEDLDYALVHESDGTPLFKLTKLAASAIKDSYPHVRLLAESYLWSLKPPKDLHLGSAGIEYAPIEMDWSQSLATGSYNRLYWDYLKEWSKHTDHIFVWLYSTNFQGYLQPLPTIYPMIKSIKELATQSKVEGVFLQDSYTTYDGSFAALHAWVYAKLLWNPTLDADALIKEFCQGYYGLKSGDLIYEYIQLLHSSFAKSPSSILTKTNVLQPYLNANFILEADTLLQQAESLAENNWYKKHIQIEHLGIQWVILSNQAALKKEAIKAGKTWSYTTENVWIDFNKTLKSVSKMNSFLEGGKGAFHGMLTGLKIDRTMPKKPELCQNLPESSCLDYQDIGFELADTQNVADASASDHSTARIAGSTNVWGIQLKLQMLLPEGSDKWDIYAVVKVKKTTQNSEATAFNVGIYDKHIENNIGTKQYKLSEIEDNIYKTIKLPGSSYSYNAQQYIWFSPPNSEDIESLSVDRIFAIKQ